MTLFEKLRTMQLTYCVVKYPIWGKNKALVEHLNCSPNSYCVMILTHEAKFQRKSDIAMFKLSEDYKGVLERELTEEEARQFRGERDLYVKVEENEDGVLWEYQQTYLLKTIPKAQLDDYLNSTHIYEVLNDENNPDIALVYKKAKSFKEEFQKRPLIISSKMNQ